MHTSLTEIFCEFPLASTSAKDIAKVYPAWFILNVIRFKLHFAWCHVICSSQNFQFFCDVFNVTGLFIQTGGGNFPCWKPIFRTLLVHSKNSWRQVACTGWWASLYLFPHMSKLRKLPIDDYCYVALLYFQASTVYSTCEVLSWRPQFFPPSKIQM